MSAVFLLYGIFAIKWGEVMAFGNGLAWDAAVYRNIAADFFGQVFNHQLNSYSIQRIFPSGIIYFTFKAFGISADDANIVSAFQILNLMCILISIYLFNCIAEHFKFKNEIKWLGFFGIFVNYAFIRQSFYYPVHTDTAAFALGMALLYFYIKKNYFGMFFVTLAGTFTWPSFIYFSLPLFAFQNENTNENISSPLLWRERGRILSFLLSIIIACAVIYLYYFNKYYTKIFTGVSPPNHSLVPVSILFMIFFFFFSLKNILSYNFIGALKKINFKNLFLWASIFIFVLFGTAVFSGSSARPETPKSLIASFLTVSLNEPGISLVSHVIYFGPLFLLTIFLWKRYCSEIHRVGTGLTVFVILTLLMAIGPESRRMINLIPVFFIFTLKVINDSEFKKSSIYIFTVFSLLFSKIWLKMNPDASFFPNDINAFQDFPWQSYFMNIGPWMSHKMYIIQASVVFITAIIFYFVLIRRNHWIKSLS